jgi:hypothetical protein
MGPLCSGYFCAALVLLNECIFHISVFFDFIYFNKLTGFWDSCVSLEGVICEEAKVIVTPIIERKNCSIS